MVRSLELKNFRNYRALEADFSPGTNLVIGGNAQGKTNLLESFFFLSRLRSDRARNNKDMITRGEKAAFLRASLETGVSVTMAVSLSERGTTVEVNGRRSGSPGKAAGTLKCVLFSPDDLYIVKGEPSLRRGYLDGILEGMGPMEAELLRRYRHLLKQRNSILRRWEEHERDFQRVIGPWDEALSRAGGAIVAKRMKMTRALGREVERIYQEVSGDGKSVGMTYRCTFSGSEDPDRCSEALREELSRSVEEDKRRRTTTAGPHRDDIELTLEGEDARYFASQGEQRTVAFSMRLAERVHVHVETGEAPVVLLDDVLSELDEGRRRKVLELAGTGSQTVITATEDPGGPLPEGGAVLRVRGGKVVQG